jgi:hypothetical protein
MMASQPNPRLTRRDIATILSRKRWHTDDQPTWRNAKTFAEAEALSRKWVKVLRRWRDGEAPPPELLALADRLDSCRPGARCGGGCCPLCGRALQKKLVALIISQAGA